MIYQTQLPENLLVGSTTLTSLLNAPQSKQWYKIFDFAQHHHARHTAVRPQIYVLPNPNRELLLQLVVFSAGHAALVTSNRNADQAFAVLQDTVRILQPGTQAKIIDHDNPLVTVSIPKSRDLQLLTHLIYWCESEWHHQYMMQHFA